MEHSPLNKAHEEQRKADVLLKHRKFDECIQAHNNAIEYLSQSTQLTNHPRALESMQLQKENHERQIRLINMKKIQYENQKNAEFLRKNEPVNEEIKSQLVDQNLQLVYDTMNQHDSFISFLSRRDGGSDNESYTMSDTEDKIEKIPSVNVIGVKHPIDDSIVIEEFKELCNSYRDSIKKLLSQLDDRNKEIKELKLRVSQLEDEKFKAQTKNHNSLKVITDSSGGTSPYIYSPSSDPSELSPEVREIGELLQLAPLESPTFDFNVLTKNLSSDQPPNNN